MSYNKHVQDRITKVFYHNIFKTELQRCPLIAYRGQNYKDVLQLTYSGQSYEGVLTDSGQYYKGVLTDSGRDDKGVHKKNRIAKVSYNKIFRT